MFTNSYTPRPSFWSRCGSVSVLAAFIVLLCPALSGPLHAGLIGAQVGFPDTLVEIDPATGASTPLTTLSRRLIGLAYDPLNDVLYGADADELYTVNVLTGATTLIGPTGLSNISGLAFDTSTGQLYGTDFLNNQLFLINTTTGDATGLGGSPSVVDLAVHPSTNVLYGANNGTDSLVTINKSTGLPSTVGPFGFQQVVALAFDPDTSILYGTDNLTDQLLTINLATGLATPVGSTSDNIQALTFAPVPAAIPEPSTLLLLGSSALGLFLFRRRIRQ